MTQAQQLIWIDGRGNEHRSIEIQRPHRIVWQDKNGTKVVTPYLWPTEQATRPIAGDAWPFKFNNEGVQ